MRSFTILVSVVVLVVECTTAKGYGGSGGIGGGRLGGGGISGGGRLGGGGIGSGYGGGSEFRGIGGDLNRGYGGSGNGANRKPTPYNIGYEAPDEEGNVHFRQEEGDGNGNVRGSYGYMDNQGLYRTVQYTAGSDGFKAVVQTNEPGTDGKENPADVIMNVQETPAGIVEKYNRRNGMGGGNRLVGIGGYRSGGNSMSARSRKSGY